jgi:hypothetical protein
MTAGDNHCFHGLDLGLNLDPRFLHRGTPARLPVGVEIDMDRPHPLEVLLIESHDRL